MLGRQVVVVGPPDLAGPRRLLAAGASRVLVIGDGVAADPGIDVHPACEILPLRSASVDVVVAASSAPLEPSAREILIREAARVLRPGGILALTCLPGAAIRDEVTRDLAGSFTTTRWLAVRRLRGLAVAPIAEAARRTVLYEERGPAGEAAAADLEAMIALASAGEAARDPDAVWMVAPPEVAAAVDPGDERQRRLAAEAELAAAQRRIDGLLAALESRAAGTRAADEAREAAREDDLGEREGALEEGARAPADRGDANTGTEAEIAAGEGRADQREAASAAVADARSEREETIAGRERELGEREETIAGRERELGEREAAVTGREREAGERERELGEREAAVTGRGREVDGREREVGAREEAVDGREREVGAREEAVAGRDREVAAREAEVAGRAAEVVQRERAAADLERQLGDLERRLSERERQLGEREATLAAREAALVEGAHEEARAAPERADEAAAGVPASGPREATRPRGAGDLDFDELEIELIDIMPGAAGKEGRGEGSELARAQALADERQRLIEALQRALDDAEERLAGLQAGASGDGEGRGGADVALDRDRLREELARRTHDLQIAEEKAWQATEAAQKERIENVRLVAEVDRLREQVERSRGAEQERLREVESLGHELRRLELAHAEVQGLLASKAQRLEELAAEAAGEGGDEDELRRALRAKSGELELLRAREHANAELVRRRERELEEAHETVAQLRRTIDDYAATAANLRGELVVIQVEVEQLQSMTPGLQQQIAEYRRKLKEREDEASELQHKLEEATSEQQHLRARLRERKRELEEASGRRDALQVELEGVRAELVVCKRAMAQLEHTVSVTSSAAEGDVVSQELRAELAAQARRFADELGRVEARSEAMLRAVRERQQRAELEAKIRADEQEYLLVQLDTCEQRIWEMTDASDRSAARLAAGLAQYEKQKEQLEDLVHELEVTRNLLAEAESRVVDLERTLASERVRLARMGVETPAPEAAPLTDPGESGVWAPVPAFPAIDDDAPIVVGAPVGEAVEARLTLDDELLRLTDAILDGEPELAAPMGVAPRSDDEYDRELEEMLASDDVMPAVLPALGLGADVDDELLADVEEAMAESRAAAAHVDAAEGAADVGAAPTTEAGIIIEILGEDEVWPDEAWPPADVPADEAPPIAPVAGEVDVSVIIDEVEESDASYIDIDIDEWSEAQRGRQGRMDTVRVATLPVLALGDDDDDELDAGAELEDDEGDAGAATTTAAELDDADEPVVLEDDGIVIVDDEDDEGDAVGVEGWLGAVLPGDDADILADLVGIPEDDDDKGG